MGEYIFICYKGQYKSVLKHPYSLLLYGVVTLHLYSYPCRETFRQAPGHFREASKTALLPIARCFPTFHPFIDYAVAETPRKLVVGETGVPERESMILLPEGPLAP
jgi:hypothetical protein